MRRKNGEMMENSGSKSPKREENEVKLWDLVRKLSEEGEEW